MAAAVPAGWLAGRYPLSTGVGVVYVPVEVIGKIRPFTLILPPGIVRRAIAVETDELDDRLR